MSMQLDAYNKEQSDSKVFLSLTVIQLVCAAVVVWYLFDCFTIYSRIKKQDSV